MEVIKARLITEIPDKRYRTIDGSKPNLGDTVIIDQGFTFEDGKAACLVYGVDSKGQFTYEAEVYEIELTEKRKIFDGPEIRY